MDHNDWRKDQSEVDLRAAKVRLAAELLHLIGPVFINGAIKVAAWWARRKEVARLEQERKELLLLQEEANRRAFVELCAGGNVKEARERFPEIALLVDPGFDAEKLSALEEGDIVRRISKATPKAS